MIGGCTNSRVPEYDPEATYDDGTCSLIVEGCTDSTADELSYRELATHEDGSCKYTGCMDSIGFDYNPTATFPGACDMPIFGCKDSRANNYDPTVDLNDASDCLYVGCADPTKFNYDPTANVNDGSTCVNWTPGCPDSRAANYNSKVNQDDGSCRIFGCADSTFDTYDPVATVNFQPWCSNYPPPSPPPPSPPPSMPTVCEGDDPSILLIAFASPYSQDYNTGSDAQTDGIKTNCFKLRVDASYTIRDNSNIAARVQPAGGSERDAKCEDVVAVYRSGSQSHDAYTNGDTEYGHHERCYSAYTNSPTNPQPICRGDTSLRYYCTFRPPPSPPLPPPPPSPPPEPPLVVGPPRSPPPPPSAPPPPLSPPPFAPRECTAVLVGSSVSRGLKSDDNGKIASGGQPFEGWGQRLTELLREAYGISVTEISVSGTQTSWWNNRASTKGNDVNPYYFCSRGETYHGSTTGATKCNSETFYRALESDGLHPRFVFFGLSLGNEGTFGTTNETLINQYATTFQTGMDTLAQYALDRGAQPYLMGVYNHGGASVDTQARSLYETNYGLRIGAVVSSVSVAAGTYADVLSGPYRLQPGNPDPCMDASAMDFDDLASVPFACAQWSTTGNHSYRSDNSHPNIDGYIQMYRSLSLAPFDDHGADCGKPVEQPANSRFVELQGGEECAVTNDHTFTRPVIYAGNIAIADSAFTARRDACERLCAVREQCFAYEFKPDVAPDAEGRIPVTDDPVCKLIVMENANVAFDAVEWQAVSGSTGQRCFALVLPTPPEPPQPPAPPPEPPPLPAAPPLPPSPLAPWVWKEFDDVGEYAGAGGCRNCSDDAIKACMGAEGVQYVSYPLLDQDECRAKCAGDTGCYGFDYKVSGTNRCYVWSEPAYHDDQGRSSESNVFRCATKVLAPPVPPLPPEILPPSPPQPPPAPPSPQPQAPPPLQPPLTWEWMEFDDVGEYAGAGGCRNCSGDAIKACMGAEGVQYVSYDEDDDACRARCAADPDCYGFDYKISGTNRCFVWSEPAYHDAQGRSSENNVFRCAIKNYTTVVVAELSPSPSPPPPSPSPPPPSPSPPGAAACALVGEACSSHADCCGAADGMECFDDTNTCVPGTVYDVLGVGGCRTCAASSTDPSVCADSNYNASAGASDVFTSSGGNSPGGPHGYNNGINGYNTGSITTNSGGCDGCAAICNADVTCKAYECSVTSTTWCELWTSAPSNFMTFGCSGNFRCRIRASVVSSGSNPAYSYSYSTSTNWHASSCVEATSAAPRSLATVTWTATMNAPVEYVESLNLTYILPTLVPVPAVGVDVTVSSGSTVVVAVFRIENERLLAFADAIAGTLGSLELAVANLPDYMPIVSVAPIVYSEGCASDGSDDTCDDWSQASWSSAAAEYCTSRILNIRTTHYLF